MSTSAQPKPRTNTGRKKVVIKKMEKMSNLQVTFAKRRPGVMKKASELATLCGAEVGVIVRCPRGKKLYSFGHPTIKEVFDKYVFGNEAPTPGPIDQMIMAQRNSRIRELNLQLTHLEGILAQEKKRAEELEFIKLQGQLEKWYPPALEEFSREELLQYLESIENFEKHINEKAKEALIHSANQSSDPTYAPPVQNDVNIRGAATGSMFSFDPTASSFNPIFSLPLQNGVGNIYGGSTFSFDSSSSNPCFPPPFQNDGGNFFGITASSSLSLDHSNLISMPANYAPPLQDNGESDQNTYPLPFDVDLGNSSAGLAEPGQHETTYNATNDAGAQIEIPDDDDLMLNLEVLFSESTNVMNPSWETNSTFPIAGTNSSWPSQNPLPPVDHFAIPWTTAQVPEGGFNDGIGGSGPYSGLNNEGTGGLGQHSGFNNGGTGGSGPYNGFNNQGTGGLCSHSEINNEGTGGSGPYNGFNNEGTDGLGPHNGFNEGNISDLGPSSQLNNSTDENGGLDPNVGLNDGMDGFGMYGGFNYGMDGSGPYGGINAGIGGSGTHLDFDGAIGDFGTPLDFSGGIGGSDLSSAFNDGFGGSMF